MTERLMNYEQGERMIAALTRIAVAVERIAVAPEPAQEQEGGEQENANDG